MKNEVKRKMKIEFAQVATPKSRRTNFHRRSQPNSFDITSTQREIQLDDRVVPDDSGSISIETLVATFAAREWFVFSG
jgi:hypothetical protein